MNVAATKVNTQPQTNLEKTVKVATKAAAIGGGIQAIGGVATTIAAATGKTNGAYTDLLELFTPEVLTGDKLADTARGVKEILSDIFEFFPKTIKKLYKPIITNEKNIKQVAETTINLAESEATRKISWKALKLCGKNSLKTAGKWGAIIGAAYLAGKTIKDHVQAKKAE